MEPKLLPTIAQVEIEGRRGTGFLVTKDLVLTALHVLGSPEEKKSLSDYHGSISLIFSSLTSKASIYNDYGSIANDWVLLKCDTPPGGTMPLPLAELTESGLNVTWSTYGFPNLKPAGLDALGYVVQRDTKSHEIQLHCDTIPPGKVADAEGFSGAPCVVPQNINNSSQVEAVVGLIQDVLIRQQQTFYARTIVSIIKECEIIAQSKKETNPLPWPDHCWGLPGIPPGDLPSEPFRYLNYFTREDAAIFFGRSQEIRNLYDLVTKSDRDPIICLYGQSGVGKSSLLEAGVRPRLEWTHEIRYQRRDQSKSLLASLQKALGVPEENRSVQEAWLNLEHQQKPVVVILDQIEQVYIQRSQKEQTKEWKDFLQVLKAVFVYRQKRPMGKLILSFRKEWFAETQKQLASIEVPWTGYFLEPLGNSGIQEIVKGLQSSERLRGKYHLILEGKLEETISQDLSDDPSSPIAPTLQILLTKMWQKAREENNANPKFTCEMYRDLKEQGIHLKDFLKDQITEFSKSHPEQVTSGLILDILAFHITLLGTAAAQRSREEIEKKYSHQQQLLPELLQQFKKLYLLVDPANDKKAQYACTRLAHDTLAPFVHQLWISSPSPGQIARRILEYHTNLNLKMLNEDEIKLVRRGEDGMRTWTSGEKTLIQASENAMEEAERARKEAEAAKRQETKKRRIQLGAGLATFVIAITLGIIGYFYIQEQSTLKDNIRISVQKEDKAAVGKLYQEKNAKIVPLLLELLRDESIAFQKQAVPMLKEFIPLWKVAEEKTTIALAPFLASTDLELKNTTVVALGEIIKSSDKRIPQETLDKIIPQICGLFSDENSKFLARKAVAKIGKRSLSTLLAAAGLQKNGERSWLESAIEAISAMNCYKEALETLEKMPLNGDKTLEGLKQARVKTLKEKANRK